MQEETKAISGESAFLRSITTATFITIEIQGPDNFLNLIPISSYLSSLSYLKKNNKFLAADTEIYFNSVPELILLNYPADYQTYYPKFSIIWLAKWT